MSFFSGTAAGRLEASMRQDSLEGVLDLGEVGPADYASEVKRGGDGEVPPKPRAALSALP
jgi:hypothetical protein